MTKGEVLFGSPSIERIAVNEKTQSELRAALAGEGYSFFANVKPLSVRELANANGKYFDHLNSSERMLSIIPSSMEVAINPNKLRLETSSSMIIGENWEEKQMELLILEENALKRRLPKNLKNLIIMPRLSASALVQLDMQYYQKTGKFIFDNWYVLSDSRTETSIAVSVGRDPSQMGLRIGDWDGDEIPVFTIPAAVLPRKMK